MKKISTLCLVLLSALASWAYDFKSGDLYYNITSDVAPYTVEVTHHSDTTQKYTQTSVKVPSSVVNAGKTYSVIRIGEEAFAFCAIESIDLPVSITSVGVGAFKLTFLTAPMVHWPEVLVSYDSAGRILFSADAFGKFRSNL